MRPPAQLSQSKKKDSSTSSESSDEETQRKAPIKTLMNTKPSQRSIKKCASSSSSDSEDGDDNEKLTNSKIVTSQGIVLLTTGILMKCFCFWIAPVIKITKGSIVRSVKEKDGSSDSDLSSDDGEKEKTSVVPAKPLSASTPLQQTMKGPLPSSVSESSSDSGDRTFANIPIGSKGKIGYLHGMYLRSNTFYSFCDPNVGKEHRNNISYFVKNTKARDTS